MSIFKKSRDKIEAEKLYALLSDKTSNYTLEEIKETIKKQGYSDKVSSLVIKTITNNKLPLKESKPVTKTKEEVLKELSESVDKNFSKDSSLNSNKKEGKEIKKESAKKEDLKKEDKPLEKKNENTSKANKKEDVKKDLKDKNLKNINKVSFFTKFINFFKIIYFFFEDIYYKMIDGVSKVIPVNKLTDRIDKAFPSFILFLLILALLIYLILSGTLSFSKTWTVAVEVYDPSSVALKDVSVTLFVKDKNISTLKTDLFGEVIFSNFKSKKQNLTIIASKENYDVQEHVFKLNKENLRQKIYLSMDINGQKVVSEDQEREISFVENDSVLITNSTLNTIFTCTNTAITPSPSRKMVLSGKLTVTAPAGCGNLRVSVTSNDFSSITNKLIDSSNKVNLVRVNLDRGTLGFSVKNISGTSIPGTDVKVFENTKTDYPFDFTTTDLYGLGQFSLEPKQYRLSFSKEGYLTHPLRGPFTVLKDNSVNTDVVLFTLEDLLDFDCSKNKYSPFCIDDEIDCLNEDLKPFLIHNQDGSCNIGTPGYISVTLKDSNTGEPVYADITLDSKLKDSDENFSLREHTSRDTNFYSFDVIDFYSYRVRVLNTEDSGYLQPDPIVVQGIDKNIVVELEYSSSLNSGDIQINVNVDEEPIANSRVYLYKEFENNFVLVNLEPKITNQYGDVNFNSQRANREYYAFAVNNLLDKQGTSRIDSLDVNSVLELSVNLENIPKLLNLKVTPNISYDINFYDSLGSPVTEFVKTELEDSNSLYYFTGSVNKVYAVLSSSGYTTYQTEYITLIPDQEVFKTIELSSLSSCQDSKVDLLGLYDSSGVEVIENIDFFNYDLSKEYRLKFKYTSCLEDAEHNKATLRLGRQSLINDEYLFFVSDQFISQDIDVVRGYKFSQEHIPDFNFTLYNQNYSSDRGFDYSGEGYKWIEIDFKDLEADVVEFSTNFRFREDSIVPFENYVLNYKSFATIYDQVYSFDPVLEPSWNEIPVYPNGYFYAQTNKYLLPFDTSDYIFSKKLKDFNGSLLEEYAGGYPLSINKFYKYDLSYLYLAENKRAGSILQTSQYTNNNLEYLSYGYTSSLENSSPGGSTDNPSNITSFLTLPGEVETNPIDPEIYYHISIEDGNYAVNDVNAEIGYHLEKYSLLKPKGFFENTNFSDSSIVSDVLDDFPKAKTNIYSYLSDENFIFNISTNFSENRVIIGENLLSFKVIDNYGAPVENVLVQYQVVGGEKISLGKTSLQGMLSDQNVFIEIGDIGKKINFIFIFSPEYGFHANAVVKNKTISSGLSIVPEEINLSASYYVLNNKVIVDEIETSNYDVLKETSYLASLNEVDFIANSSLFNINLIKEKMIEENSLPKEITETQTEVVTSLFLNSNINQSVDLNGFYRNTLDVNNSLSQILDVNLNVQVTNLGSLSYKPLIEEHFMKGLAIENNNLSLELVKGLNESIALDYNFSSSSSQVVLESISATLPEFLDLPSFNEGISSFVGQTLSSEGLIVPLNFKINESFTGTYPSSSQDVEVIFNILLNDKPISFTQTISLKAYDTEDVFSITTEGDLSIFCTSDDCSQNKTFTFKKLVNNYLVSLSKTITKDPTIPQIAVSSLASDINFIDNSVKTRAPEFSLNYGAMLEDSYTGDFYLNFTIKLLNNNYVKKIPVAYILTKIPEEETTSQITFDSCIGVGGQEINNNLFILGSCQDTQDSCKTGEGSVPKVFFNWGNSDLSLDISRTWNNACISDDLGLMSSRYSCDSLQMLISIFSKIGNGVDDEFYIKLLNDGLSSDLLKAFTDYAPLYANYEKPSSEIFSDLAVDDGLFKVTINNQSNLREFSPGIYKVLVYGNLEGDSYSGDERDEMIDIRLDFVRELPASELTVFHYMPFDGDLQKDETREGYGIKTISNSDVVPLTEDFDINYTNVNNPVYQLSLINYNKENSSLTETLKSKGNILELNKGNDTIELIYTPSYPVPIYSHVACLNKNNFSYNLYRNTDSLSNIVGSSFLDWNYNNIILKDQKVSISGEIERYELNSNQDGSININTMAYLPTRFIIEDLKLKTTEFSNNKNTTLFTKNNLTGISNADLVFSMQDHVIGNNISKLNTIRGIFNFIKEEQACIEKSLDTTTIKWIDENVSFTLQELEDIQENIPVYSCIDGEIAVD